MLEPAIGATAGHTPQTHPPEGLVQLHCSIPPSAAPYGQAADMPAEQLLPAGGSSVGQVPELPD
jgi:hypothetical protein